jgi:hypothetical protein
VNYIQQEISCSHNGDDNRNDYVLVYSGADLRGGEGDDVLEVLAASYETYYNGETGADTFKCSPSPADIVQDYNPGEGDTVSADCETVKGSTPPEPIQTDLTLNTITNVPWGKDLTVPGKLADASQAGGVGRKTITFDGTAAENITDVITNTDGTFTAKGSSPNIVATGCTCQAHFASNSEYTASNSNIKTYNTVNHNVTLVAYTLSTGLIYLDLTGKVFASTKGREYLKRFEELNCSENDILQKRSLLISLLEGGDIQKTC